LYESEDNPLVKRCPKIVDLNIGNFLALLFKILISMAMEAKNVG
jgi:hypothetical protein